MIGADVVTQVQGWVPVAIAVAIALGPAWVVFRSRAMKEELRLLRESVTDLGEKLVEANTRIDLLQRENSEAVARQLLDVFRREGLFERGATR